VRLLVHVEGQTEESVVNELLAPYLFKFGYYSVSARLLGNSRLRVKRGGVKPWNVVRGEVCNHLNQDRGAIATTFVDYYALPSGEEGWPGRRASADVNFEEKAQLVEYSIHRDLCEFIGNGFNPMRFVPYIAMHEFEGLLFSDCDALARGLGNIRLAESLRKIRNEFNTPEHINDSPMTAPSKRIQSISKGYQKPLHGPLAALEMGIDVIRAQCAGFDGWINRLVDAAHHSSANIISP
jgi:Domain of unknown function (DUF4276)